MLIEKMKRIPLFKSVNDTLLKDLNKEYSCRILSYDKGNIIAFRGDVMEYLYILEEGVVSTHIASIKGKILKVETLTSPHLLAGPLIFANPALWPVQITADTGVRILSIPKEGFVQLLHKDIHLMEKFLQLCGNKISFLSEKIHLYQHTNIKQKIAIYLLEQVNQQGTKDIQIPHTLESLAELFSISRPSLSRTIGELVEEQFIVKEKKTFHILDKEGLEHLIYE
ncbi:Crp/Fnr family transcriptional regulator [Spirochaeta cellobiosiphila]|uniref:Crp/Fnr family transcriptional regulator n=1 Tax=Spirochaeta cellobiosiphila TaxID=504483 RepID=UPI0004207946|nr:Crp/Fnr family transcriptional regulator [Spirochaeta cellobiosiphila]